MDNPTNQLRLEDLLDDFQQEAVLFGRDYNSDTEMLRARKNLTHFFKVRATTQSDKAVRVKEYHKIKTLWARESDKPHNMIVGEFALPEFELLKDTEWTWTEKVDGTNVRVMWDGNKVSFGGKTDNAQMPMFLLEKLQEMFAGEANEQVFEQVFGGDPATLYGEGYGARIQKGGGDYGEPNFVLFDVNIDGWWLERKNVEDIAQKLGIEVVPIIGTGTLQDASEFAAEEHKSVWGKAAIEGIVAKPTVELQNRRGERIITKLKFKDFQKLTPPHSKETP